jgi:hypothetical protein
VLKGDFMEYINIISQEEIMEAFQLPIVIVGSLTIASMVFAFIYLGITKNADKTMKYFCVAAPISMGCLIITCAICGIFFKVPTGRYKYQATIDKDKVTVSQYLEFIEEHNPTIKDGVYYWED